MSRFPTALRSTLLAGLIAGSAALLAPGVSHAEALFTFSANLHCTAGVTEDITVFSPIADDKVVAVSLVTSIQTTTESVNVPGNGSAVVSIPVSVGERIDKIVLRDVDDVVLYQGHFGIVITGAGDCSRQAFDLFELTAYSLTCVDGVTHAAISIENRGDYARNVSAEADAWFPTTPEYADASLAGLIFPDAETLLITPGATRVFHLEFKVVDAFELYVRRAPDTIFADGPRTPVAGEGCGTETLVTEPSTTSTTVADTTPDSTPDTTDGQNDSQGPSQTTVPATVEPAPRALPVTGRGSLPVGIIAGLLLTGGIALVRTTRRGYR